jgi:hypothetical protein
MGSRLLAGDQPYIHVAPQNVIGKGEYPAVP